MINWCLMSSRQYIRYIYEGKLANQKQELPVVAMFVNGSG